MMPIDELFTLTSLASLATLALMEIVLGIDNVVFVSLMLGHMPEKDRVRGRRLWMIFGILVRSGLLVGLIMLVNKGDTTLLTVAGGEFSLRHIILLFAGMFLLYRAVKDIHDRMEGRQEA
ncbi:MAG: TerC family protein, partial [Flavobacteriales bacterium]